MSIELNYIKEIAVALAEHHAAVMVGAGFSRNAEKISATDNSFLDWNHLSDLFYENLYGKSDKPGKNYNSSLRLAEEVEIMVGRPGLEKILKQAVPDEDHAPSELFVQLMELPWNDVFTTNYDTLLERTADLTTNRRYNVVVCQEDLVNSNDAPRIVKLHGSFPSQRPFIITEEDYRTYPMKFAPMVNTVQQALLENVFCMVGFSCEDPNFINWIGWIHDHLSKSSSQKIYMVSVSHVPEAQKRLYFERNIIVVDLEELWPNLAVVERLTNFLGLLREQVEEKETQKNWFSMNEVRLGDDVPFKQKTVILQKLRLTYPGWIFLPWDLKKKTAYLLMDIEWLKGFDKISFIEQLDYMYEYVKIFEIAGRPLLLQTVEQFWKILSQVEWKFPEIAVEQQKCMREKAQTIYLQLLRAYRELADWEMFQECRQRIKPEKLNYEEKQFLYAEECRADLFRFKAQSLATRLEEWQLSEGDVYWPLIKAYLLASVGEATKAESILVKNLSLVRKQLMKDAQSAYLASIEESNVSLLNYIRQGNYKFEKERKLEKCIHEGALSWWDENERYYLHLKAEIRSVKEKEVKYEFNLKQSYIMHFGVSNDDIYTAMEYWRFFEQTGHAFRLGNVTSKEGLEGSVKRLCRYYPYWSLIQILTAQEKKYVDYLFGRAALAGMSAEEADKEAREYIQLFKTVMEQAKSENWFGPQSIYEQAAGILPGILARFSYKCSVEVLDEMLELLLGLCLSNKQANFRGLREMLNGVIGGFSQEQQAERINKILLFPIASERTSEYLDPINYLCKPKKKYKLEENVYHRVMLKLHQELEGENRDVRKDAINRYIVLRQILVLEKTDEQYLFKLLENTNDIRDWYLLYEMGPRRYRKYLNQIVDATFERMKGDISKQSFSARGSEYAELLWVLGDVYFSEYDIEKWFEVLTALIDATAHWLHSGAGAEERIRQSCIIAQGILVSLYKSPDYKLEKKAQDAILAFSEKMEQIYGSALSFKVAGRGLLEEDIWDIDTLEWELWICSGKNIELFHSLLRTLAVSGVDWKENERLAACMNRVTEIFGYRLIKADMTEAKELMALFETLVKCGNLAQKTLDLIELKLQQLVEETRPQKEDSEEEAIEKLLCRIASCRLAAALYHEKKKLPWVMEWKNVSKDKDEFAEVRKIEFH